MNRADLNEIKKNAKNAYDYMSMLVLRYYEGRNYEYKEKFIKKLSIYHSKQEIELLINDLEYTQNSKKNIFSTFFSIVIPTFASLFSFFAGVFGGLLNLNNLAIMEVVKRAIDKKKYDLISSIFSNGEKVYNLALYRFATAFLIFLLFLLINYVWSSKVTNRSIEFINILKSAKVFVDD